MIVMNIVEKHLEQGKIRLENLITHRNEVFKKRTIKWQKSDKGVMYDNQTFDISCILDNVDEALEQIENIKEKNE